jgi:hypothetical protein
MEGANGTRVANPRYKSQVMESVTVMDARAFPALIQARSASTQQANRA